MKKVIFFTILLFLPQCLLFGQMQKTVKVDKETKREIQAQLKDMLNTDQQYRWLIMYGESDRKKLNSVFELPFEDQFKILKKYDTPEYGLSKQAHDSLWVLQNKLDSVNLVRLKTIISDYGWPDEKRFGKNRADIILTHADEQTVFEMRELLLNEVKAKRLNPTMFAIIWDRKLIDAGKKQLYGTIHYYDKDGILLPPAVENIDSTNTARKAIGLKKFNDKWSNDIKVIVYQNNAGQILKKLQLIEKR